MRRQHERLIQIEQSWDAPATPVVQELNPQPELQGRANRDLRSNQGHNAEEAYRARAQGQPYGGSAGETQKAHTKGWRKRRW